MKKVLFFVLCSFFAVKLSFSQPNLVPNPSFELIKNCPDSFNTIDTNRNIYNWFAIGGYGGVANLYNSCANAYNWRDLSGVPKTLNGYQMPKTGNGFVGLVVSNFHYSSSNVPGLFNDYLGVKLETTCIKRLKYEGYLNTSSCGLDSYTNKLFQASGDISRLYTSANIGMYLSGNVPTILNGRRLELPAQINNDPLKILSDTVNWMEISGIFEANGTEQFLFIGNFTDSASCNFYNSFNYTIPWLNKKSIFVMYFMDDVSLIPQNTTHYYDTLLCSYKALQLGAVAQADSFEWYDGNKTDKIRSFTNAGLVWVKSWLYGGTVYMWDSLNIISNNINSGLPKDTFLCNEQTQLNISTTNTNAGATYLWNNGSIGKSLVLNNINWVNGKAQVWLTTTANYCTQTDTLTIYQKPALQIPINDTTTCFEDVPQILLDAGANFKSYLWLPTGETSKTVYSNQAQIYKLTVTDSFNCSASKNIIVDELCKAEIFLPNAFTPNGDGKNETYKPILKIKNLLQYQLKIYDSWGTAIFSTTDPNQTWDAKNNPQGVYVVTVNYQYKNFAPSLTKGTVTVLR